MSVALFVQASCLQQFAASSTMPKKAKKKTKPCDSAESSTIRVGVSSPHGQLLYIEIHPQMFVSEAIAEVMLHVRDNLVLSVNADWTEIQQGCPVAQRSFKLSTYDGNMLDGGMPFAAQMTKAQMHTFYKMVWVKQYNIIRMDHALMHNFADRSKCVDNLGCPMKQGNTFYVRAVCGGSDRPEDILGLVWHRSIIEKHCIIKREHCLDPK